MNAFILLFYLSLSLLIWFSLSELLIYGWINLSHRPEFHLPSLSQSRNSSFSCIEFIYSWSVQSINIPSEGSPAAHPPPSESEDKVFLYIKLKIFVCMSFAQVRGEGGGDNISPLFTQLSVGLHVACLCFPPKQIFMLRVPDVWEIEAGDKSCNQIRYKVKVIFILSHLFTHISNWVKIREINISENIKIQLQLHQSNQ